VEGGTTVLTKSRIPPDDFERHVVTLLEHIALPAAGGSSRAG
jgi:hypothetical protein